MSIVKILLVIGIVLTVVKVLFGPRCWFCAVEAAVRLLVVALDIGCRSVGAMANWHR